ncbi:MFS transporter [Streptomyces sp. NPDC050988]|uniref:MFS transporter n=1 Tax=Streptomyces sp. NPDC050988 TaxID=3365637 RepID=UPI0037978AEF
MRTAATRGGAAAGEAGRESFAWPFTTPLYVGSALNPINSSIIATAMVPIAADLNVSIGSTAVLVSSLYLASAVAQPTAGKLAEVLGPRRISLSGIVLVLLGGVVGGLGQNLATLTVARVLIGISTSGVVLSTLIDVADRDYRVYVLTDGLADSGPEVHRILVDKVFPSRAHLIDTTQLSELLKAA